MYIRFVRIAQVCGDFSWGVFDSEELARVTYRRWWIGIIIWLLWYWSARFSIILQIDFF